MQRRTLIQTAAVMATGALVWPVAAQAKPQVEVWKSPTCGCCQDWVAHMEANGFSVKTYETGNNAVRARLGLPHELGSCHTALVDGYVIEGHVPAADVMRCCSRNPKRWDWPCPACPSVLPGMDGPAYGNRRTPMTCFGRGGTEDPRVYKSYHQAHKG